MIEAGQRWRARSSDHHEVAIVEPVHDRDDSWIIRSESGRTIAVLASEIESNFTLLDL